MYSTCEDHTVFSWENLLETSIFGFFSLSFCSPGCIMEDSPVFPLNCFMAVLCQFASRFLLNCCRLTFLKHKCRMIELPTYHWVFCKRSFQRVNASGFYVSIDCWRGKETFGSIQHCANTHLLAGKRNWPLPLTVTSSLPSFLPFFLTFSISIHTHTESWNLIHIIAKFQLT